MDSRALSYGALTPSLSHPPRSDRRKARRVRRRGSAASRMGEGLEMDSRALSDDFLVPEGSAFTLVKCRGLVRGRLKRYDYECSHGKG